MHEVGYTWTNDTHNVRKAFRYGYNGMNADYERSMRAHHSVKKKSRILRKAGAITADIKVGTSKKPLIIGEGTSIRLDSKRGIFERTASRRLLDTPPLASQPFAGFGTEMRLRMRIARRLPRK